MKATSIPAVAYPLLAVGGLILFLAGAVLLSDIPLESWLRHYGVPAQHRPFGDLGVIAQGIVDRDAGLPVYQYPPTKDQKVGGLFNYPRLWLLWKHLGLRPSTLIPWGVAIGTLFLVTAALTSIPANAFEGCYLSVLLCSPVCVLAVERGNSDLVIFVLLAWGMIFARPTIIRFMAILIGGAAKLYPVAAIGGLLLGFRPRERFILLAFLGATSLGWVAITWQDWIAIAALTPQMAYLSYGSNVPWLSMAEHTDLELSASTCRLLGWATALPVAAATAAIASLPNSMHATASPFALRGLYAGVGIFVFTWLLGSSFQYRLIFLLGCLPALWAGRTLPVGPDRILSRTTLIAIPVYFWWDLLIGEGSLLAALTKQLICITLVVSLAAYAIRTWKADPMTTKACALEIN